MLLTDDRHPLLRRLYALHQYNQQRAKGDRKLDPGKRKRRCLKCTRECRMTGGQRLCSRCLVQNDRLGLSACPTRTQHLEVNP